MKYYVLLFFISLAWVWVNVAGLECYQCDSTTSAPPNCSATGATKPLSCTKEDDDDSTQYDVCSLWVDIKGNVEKQLCRNREDLLLQIKINASEQIQVGKCYSNINITIPPTLTSFDLVSNDKVSNVYSKFCLCKENGCNKYSLGNSLHFNFKERLISPTSIMSLLCVLRYKI